ncbi:MAG: gliding motility-associated C-terminal domain-containing protein [Crocinitomicaceae bacterium]|nr:gliding motility-associated C-terminal domain-containing protein [Crocinitomicaceae bacterium]
MKRLLLPIFLLFFGSINLFAQNVWMHPNAGQWDSRIEYKVELQMGEMYIEKDGFTYNLSDIKTKSGHDHGVKPHGHHDEEIKSHVIKSNFLGSNWGREVVQSNPSGFYRNYFLGNDQSKWKSKLHSYSALSMIDLYSGIDLLMDGSRGGLKYSFQVAPNVDADQIQMSYEGQDSLYIDELGNLHIANIFGEIIEEAPRAWLMESSRKIQVDFKIVGKKVSFDFPDGYDESKTLIIDPTLTFSTFTGATADNWGMSATPDANGNLVAGGTVFGLGYPITVGVFDTTFNGGVVDAVVTKFTADGSNLVFSTYLGGGGSETTNSMISDHNDDLYVFGVTSSTNFPMAGVPYDATHNGGPAPTNSNGLGFSTGTDLFIAKFSADGTTLMASTYVGGSGVDGLNNSGLAYNYGDEFRGEINVDDNGFVYVSSTTKSADFPTVMGSQSALAGTHDAVVFKMTPALNTMIWSTYFGGSGVETGNSVTVFDNGDVFIAGGSTSTSLPFNLGHDLTYGGISDGYLARFNGANGALLTGTYIGMNEYDQSYIVQLDIDGFVYVLGQTESDLGVTPGQYGIANSGQFIRKYDPNLMSLQWTTMIGSGSGHVEMSPTAFLVSDCYDIYLSGWGGSLNSTNGSALYSSVSGFPITGITAYQTTTNGENFYIAVLDQDATSLKYATYFGGTNNLASQHVDGGTSRFDKSGRIYHAVCGSCGASNNGFTTTPGVWAPLSGSGNCNLAAFKFELSTIEALVTTPDPIVCLPDPVIFNNNSANGNAFFWDFGDNTYSNLINPTHLYPGAGTYTVTLVVTDTNQCFSPDSVEFIIIIGDFNGGVVTPPGPICPGDSYQLEAFGGVDFVWTPAAYLDDPNIAMPTATLTQTTDFMVIISDSCGIDTAYVTVPVHIGTTTISNDTSICIGNDVPLFATGGTTYEWSPSTYLDDPFSATPISLPLADIAYSVSITTSNGCDLSDTVRIDVYYTPPIPIMPDILQLCQGASTEITVSGAQSYHWYPNSNITFVDTNVVTVSPTEDFTYYCDFTNACGTTIDSVFLDVITSNITAGTDTIICPGQTTPIWAQGGISYVWSPYQTLNNANTSLVYATPTEPTTYYVIGTDQYGCSDTASVFVDLYPQPFIQTSPDVYAFLGDLVPLSATSTTSGPYQWYPTEFLNCVICENPVANPDQNYTYWVTYTDNNGCTASDSVNIYYDPIIWIPNTFTPGDGDAHNNLFFAEGGNIKTFEMLIFNRWGELIVTLNDLTDSWDGTYDGVKCQDGTYVWKVTLTSFEDEESIYNGHINLLR